MLSLSRYRHLPWIVFFAIAGFVSAFLDSARADDDDRPLRAAMIGIVSDDAHSAREIELANLSDALHTHLARDPSLEWVQRDELDAVFRELALSLGGPVSSTDAIRVGNWVRADLLVRGVFFQDDGAGSLVFEFIDLNRADLLAERRVRVPDGRLGGIQVTPDFIRSVAEKVHSSLDDAVRRLNELRLKRTVAPLYFANLSESPRLTSFERDLRASLAATAERDGTVHALSFPRPLQAAPENEFVLAGFADADAWSSIADLYVWGSFQEIPSGEPEQAFLDIPVEVELFFWDGTATPERLVVRDEVRNLSTLADQIAGEVVRRTKASNTNVEHDPLLREETATSLVARAEQVEADIRRLGFHTFLRTELGREYFGYRLNLLQTAVFFDPLDRDLRRALLDATWSSPDPFGRLLSPEGHWRRVRDYRRFAERFPFQDDGSIDDRIRIETLDTIVAASRTLVNPSGIDPNRVQTYRMRFFSTFADEVESVNQWAKVPGNSNDAWLEDYNRMAFERFFQQGHASSLSWRGVDPATRFSAVERLWPYFRANVHALRDSSPEGDAFQYVAGVLLNLYARFGLEHVAIEMLTEPGKGTVGRSVSVRDRPPDPPAPEASPSAWGRWNESGIRADRSLFGAEIQAVVTDVGFRLGGGSESGRNDREGVVVHGTSWFHFVRYHAGRLWISETADGLFGWNPPHRNPRGRHYFWAFDPLTRETDSVTALLGEHSAIRDVLFAPGKSWLGLQADGIWDLDTRGDAVGIDPLGDGLQTPSVTALANSDDDLFIGGGGGASNAVLSRYAINEGEWYDIPVAGLRDGPGSAVRWRQSDNVITGIIADKDRLVVALGGFLHVFDRESGEWRSIMTEFRQEFGRSVFGDSDRERRAEASAERQRSFRPGYQGILPPAGVIAEDGEGYWFGNRQGLYFVDAGLSPDGAFHDPVGHVTAMAHDGDHLWVAVMDPVTGDSVDPTDEYRSHLLLFCKSEREWKGHLPLQETAVGALAARTGVVWVASDRLYEIRLPHNTVPAGSITARDDGATGWEVLRQVDDYALHRSVLRNDLAESEALLRSGADPDRPLPGGRRPIHFAAEAGNLDGVRVLLEYGADPNATANDGRFALLTATEQGNLEMASLLLDRGACANHRPESPLVVPASADLRDYTSNRDPYIYSIVPPRQPENLTADVLSANAVRLTWENRADNASRIRLYRRDSVNRTFILQAVLPSDAREYVDTDFRQRMPRPIDLDYVVWAINGSNFQGHFTTAEGSLDAGNHTGVTLPGEGRFDNAYLTASEAEYLLRAAGRAPLHVSTGRTALMAAATEGRTESIARLLSHGTDVNKEDVFGHTAFLLAAANGQREAMRLLIESGADPNARNVFGETALEFEYTHGDDLGFFNFLIEAGADINRAGRETLLMRAAREGRFDDVERFLDAGADPNIVDRGGATAFSLAYSRGYTRICELLLERGFQPSLRYWRVNGIGVLGDRIVERSIERDDVGMLERMLSRGVDPNGGTGELPYLFMAVRRDSPDAVRTLLVHGASSDVTSPAGREIDGYVVSDEVRSVLQEFGRTAGWSVPLPTTRSYVSAPQPLAASEPVNLQLLEAASSGDLDRIFALLEEGAEVNARDERGWTPLVSALQANHGDVARLLIERGADLNALTKAGSSPLVFAVLTGDSELVEELLNRGANPNQIDYGIGSPLHGALMVDLRIARLLLDRGAAPGLFSSVDSETGRSDITPLQFAARTGDVEAVRLLLDRGAPIDARSVPERPSRHSPGDPISAGATAFLYAACSGDVALLEYMIYRGSDPHHMTHGGANALYWAVQCGNLPVVEFLLSIGQWHDDAIDTATTLGHTTIAERLRAHVE